MDKKRYTILIIVLLATFEVSASWVQRADFGSHGRHRGSSFSIGKRGYMGLGHYNGAGPNIVLKDWWEYDPGTNSWTQKADYIGNNNNGNYGVLSFSTPNYGYIGGGQQGGDNRLYRYDPTSNSWTAMSNTPTTPKNTEGFVIDGKGYYLSGSSLYEYDFASDTWTTKNSAPFSVGIWNSAFSINEKGYVKTGYSLWEYKPLLDDWILRTNFPGIATSASVALVSNNKVYLVSGYGNSLSNVTKQVWEYDPYTNVWSQMGDFPGSSRRFGSGFVISDRAFIGIGTNGTNFNDFYELDPWADVNELFDQNNLKVYPNPSTDYIIFNLDKTVDFDIEIKDLLGKKIFSETTTNGLIQFFKGKNPSGIYLYHLKMNGAIVNTGKIILK